jgi:thiopeptide-type bacteriocin biosynthesis protein
VPFDNFVVRTPLLPADSVLHDSLPPPSSPESFSERRTVEKERVAQLIATPAVRAAMQIASPSLAGRMDRSSGDAPAERELLMASLKYLIRMSTRSTPFGLFASTGIGTTSTSKHFTAPEDSYPSKRSRVDMGVMQQLDQMLSDDEYDVTSLSISANNTLYRLAGAWRYTETLSSHHGQAHNLVEIESNDLIDAFIDFLSSPRCVRDVIDMLMSMDPEIGLIEATDFVYSLVRMQVAVPESGLRLTGQGRFAELLSRLSRSRDPRFSHAHRILGLAIRILARADRAFDWDVMRRLHVRAERVLLSLPVATRPGKTIQVDAYHSGEIILPKSTIESIAEQLPAIFAICSEDDDISLRRFAKRFRDRYGSAEIPLFEALDHDVGVGFGPGADDAFAPAVDGGDGGGSRPYSMRPIDLILLQKIAERPDVAEIVLTAADLAALPEARFAPQTCSALVTLMSNPLKGAEPLIVINSVSGPSGTQLLGRFCDGSDAINSLVTSVIAEEERHAPGTFFAEIVHTPQGRHGNVIARPTLRQFEIPYLARSGVPKDRQIPVSDLLVGVDGERIYLRSRSRGSVVLPRLSTAHNFVTNTPDAYLFLNRLQMQDGAGVRFRWGASFKKLRHVPRVRIGSVILGLRTWRVDAAVVSQLRKMASYELFIRCSSLRVELGLPRYVRVRSGDNHLTIDLESPLGLELFSSELPRSGPVDLEEVVGAPGTGPLKKGDRTYEAEAIIPFSMRSRARNPPPHSLANKSSDRSKQIYPGAEWAYIKLYASRDYVDRYVRWDLRWLVLKLKRLDPSTELFYVRYGDPDWHLRIRVKADPKRLWNEHVPSLLQSVHSLAGRYQWSRIQIDTYEPETHRYGGESGLQLCEDLFCLDSYMYLRALPGVAAPETFWFALVSADRLARMFAPAAGDLLQLFDTIFAAQGRKLMLSDAGRRGLAEKFRENRAKINALLTGDGRCQFPDKAVAAIDRRTRRSLSSVEALHNTVAPSAGLGIVSSLIHMSMNRAFSVDANDNELLIYYYLTRHYESIVAREQAA